MASSTTIAEISRLDLQALQTPPAAFITDVKHLASYNWIEAPTPTIAVPGIPALWSAPRVPQRVKKDSGLIYIAQNAVRHPDSPLEPLFRALYVENPSFDIRSVDVVTDRNNIRKLLSFVNPNSSRNGLEPFTIHVEVSKKTAVFCRKETATTEFIGPNEFRGFGHEFEKACTTSQIAGSTGHHRIVSYRFGGLSFIVRHETDGYVADAGSKAQGSDGLSSMLATLSLSPTKDTPPHGTTTPAGSKLTVKLDDHAVPLASTLEIKTRVAHKPLAIKEVAPQLWVSQTPKLVRAYHNRGTFAVPEVEDVAAEIKRWEDVNQKDLKKLAALINKVLSVVRESGRTAMLKYEEGQGDKLVIFKVADGGSILPEDLYSNWDDADVTEAEAAPGGPVEDASNVRVLVGAKEYLVDIKKIPYFESYLSFRRNAGQDTAPLPTHDDIPFFEVINYGARNGFRQFFRRMPTRLSDYHVLCETLEFLAVDVLAGRKLRDIMGDLRSGKGDWDPEERVEIKGATGRARDSAFRLLYIFVLGEFESEVRDSNMAYNAALFVVSHPRIFKYRTRKMVREAFEERFLVSQKQRKGLDKWPINDSSSRGSEEDVTTEEEDFGFDSDFGSDYY